MRYFCCRPGTFYEGEHTIYESRKEFIDTNPSLKYFQWNRCNVEELQNGDWIEAEDGYIVQLLKIVPRYNKSSQLTYFVRVPMGTFTIYKRADGTYKWARFYAMFSNGDSNSASNKMRGNLPKTTEIVKFSTYVIAGIHPIKAFKAVFPNKYIKNKHQLLSKVVAFMSNELVKREITEQIQVMSDDIRKEIPGSVIGKNIKDLLEQSKKGSGEHRENIKFVLGIFNLLPPVSKDGEPESIGYKEINENDSPPPINR